MTTHVKLNKIQFNSLGLHFTLIAIDYAAPRPIQLAAFNRSRLTLRGRYADWIFIVMRSRENGSLSAWVYACRLRREETISEYPSQRPARGLSGRPHAGMIPTREPYRPGFPSKEPSFTADRLPIYHASTQPINHSILQSSLTLWKDKRTEGHNGTKWCRLPITRRLGRAEECDQDWGDTSDRPTDRTGSIHGFQSYTSFLLAVRTWAHAPIESKATGRARR